MRPDTTPLIAAAHRRHQLTRAKAIQALRELTRDGTPITFEAVAVQAGVSRSWLYTQPDLRAQIQQLRQQPATAPTPIPPSQRPSQESLRARLDTALQRNRQLTQENQRLRQQLAEALGDNRTDRTPSQRQRARSRFSNDQPR